MKRLLIVIFLGLSIHCQADYLEVYRNTSIRSEAKAGSDEIYALKAGDLLVLLDSGIQYNGYYHVQYPGSTLKGYIYRSLVKRIKGDFPGFYNTDNALEVTVIDVDAGLSAFIKLPNGKVMVYDAGRYNRAYDYIKSKYPIHSDIEYLILSHTDADHWGAAKELAENYNLKHVLRTDYRDNSRSKTLNDGVAAIQKNTSTIDMNLSVPGNEIVPGTLIYNEDGVEMYFLMGFGTLPPSWESYSTSKKNNGVSITVKLVYGDHSILFTGDAVGRIDGEDGCIASEKFMLDTLSEEMIDTDVLIAAHHGADNANCMGFIEAASPDYVVFSAGHKYHHPNLSTALRFISYGIPPDHMFRTDTYDYESGGSEPHEQEWNYPPTTTDQDIVGDDHVRIVIPYNGNIQIGYELEE